MDQYIGRLLDNRYEILEIIGTGGMAVVYKARCHRLNRLVAIKILKDEFARDEEFRRRFRAEGEAVAMLSHPNIVQVYDVSSTDEGNYIVMELIDGISLKQYMEKKGVLNWKETLHFAMQIAKGLEHAHSRGIVHRDIKPHNVMVLKNGSVKVMDFGIARVMNKSNTLTKEALGSVHYISPEQAKGGHTDNRADLYSLGVVMYEMMTGRPPYDGESAVSVAIQHINGGAPKPSTLNPNMPVGLEQIIVKAMALELRDRYASATEMLQDMEEFRKNPNIVFQHHTLLDDSTRTLPSGIAARTTADRMVQAKTGIRPEEPKRRSTGKLPQADIGGSAELVRRTQQRRKAEEKRRVEERSRIATTAIVICSAVAVIAIVVFLVALFNGALLNRKKDLVQVPNLKYEMYGEGFEARYEDFVIHLNPKQYSEVYAEGQIMSQNPAPGEEVQKGSDLWLTVSMGKEPPQKLMDDYVNVDVDQAEAALISQGFQPLRKTEENYIYEAGKVIRTEPSKDTPLTPGQTVYLYVSTGTDIQEALMPNVVGLEINRAQKYLEQMGFTNIVIEQITYIKPAGEVVKQSHKEDTLMDVSTQIKLWVSTGPDENAPETIPTVETEPTQPELTTVPVTFALPEMDEDFKLEICLSGTNDILESKWISAGVTSNTVELSGKGVVPFDLYINGTFYNTQEVKFGDE
ncbi:MAG: Stk1 family PASTA domain-containing Ser/Thr kinase [Eubacteriales bacterium]|nr:Stk1 family PASTA domain-containing Ser/Thr kinase [Eubacteriales bacterium]